MQFSIAEDSLTADLFIQPPPNLIIHLCQPEDPLWCNIHCHFIHQHKFHWDPNLLSLCSVVTFYFYNFLVLVWILKTFCINFWRFCGAANYCLLFSWSQPLCSYQTLISLSHFWENHFRGIHHDSSHHRKQLVSENCAYIQKLPQQLRNYCVLTRSSPRSSKSIIDLRNVTPNFESDSDLSSVRVYSKLSIQQCFQLETIYSYANNRL